MKKICTLSIVCLLAFISNATEIDNIKTKEDLNKFMVTKVDTILANWMLKPTSISDTGVCPVNSFYKADINGDGLTDLIVSAIGGRLFWGILDKGNGKYDLITMPYNSPYGVQYSDNRQPLINILKANNNVLFVTREEMRINDTIVHIGPFDTLIYKFGTLITYNPSPDTFKIAHINLDVDGLLMSTIYVDLDCSGKFKYIYGYDEHEKYTMVSQDDFMSICITLNYLGFSHHKEHFSRDCDDCGELKLTVTYANGKTKKIEDYGMQGTAGLVMLYKQLFRLCRRDEFLHSLPERILKFGYRRWYHY